jgi:hypothetical protein
MSFLRAFLDKRQKPDPEDRERVRRWAEAVLGPEGVSLTLSEVECADPACPGMETIILVMRAGEATQAVKIRKPMAQIVETDLAEALRYL